MTAVIKSAIYAESEANLATDPIILAMVKGLPVGFNEFDDWSFILAASNEYNNRGGKLAVAIGGPAAAIKALMTS